MNLKKLIHKDTKKNRAILQRLLTGKTVKIGSPVPREVNGGEALLTGNDYMLRGLVREALSIAEVLVAEFPTIIDCHLLKLNALINLEYLVEARDLAKFLTKHAPTNLGVLQANAKLHMIFNQSEQARMALNAALKLSPGNVDLLQILGEFFEQQGDTGNASRIYHKVIDIASRKNNVALVEQAMFQLSAMEGLDEPQTAIAKGILAESPEDNSMFTLAFAIARSARKHKDIDTEIEWLNIANKKMKLFEGQHGKKWEYIEILKRSAFIKDAFPTKQPSWLNNYSSTRTEAPIFIMAMPRSGTTLLEQILGAHPLVGQTGESRALNNAVQLSLNKTHAKNKSFPYGITSLTQQLLDQIARKTIEHEMLLTDKPCMVNKNLSNHRYAGLAIHLFPNAKFIYLKRNKLDNCLSIYQQQLVNASYSTNLRAILEAQSVLEDMALYWHSLYPEKVYLLEYEKMVSCGEQSLPPLLDFLELKWTDELLRFNERKNLVRTPSVNQVREKLNTKAIDKWRQYENLLADVMPLAKPTK